MDRWQYLLLLAGCVLFTLPLEWLLGARVYRRPLRALRTVLPVAAVFVVWDALAATAGVWAYNPRFVLGIDVFFGLPLEEVLFFLVIPLCGLLTYGAVESMLAGRERARPPQGEVDW